MTYTKNDVTLSSENTSTITLTTPSVDQDNYFLKLNNGQRIVSYDVSNAGECEQASLSDGVAKPFYTTNSNANGNCSGFIWPMSDAPEEVTSSMYTTPGYNAEAYGDTFTIKVNQKPNEICLTRLAQQNSDTGATNEKISADIVFYDENYDRYTATLSPSEDGNKIVLQTSSSASIELYSENTATIAFESKKIDQDNYFLQLKNGKKIKSYSVNKQCAVGDLNSSESSPAESFYVGCSAGKDINNGFIWPLGGASEVFVTMYTALATGETKAIPLYNPFKIKVNQREGAICLTRLLKNGAGEAKNNFYYAYISFTDEDGVTGQVIVGPDKSNNSGLTMKVLNVQDVFGTYSMMNLEFSESLNSSSATIYGNTRNQVPVTVRLAATDDSLATVDIPLTKEDVFALTTLVDDGNNKNLIRSQTVSSTDNSPWYYTTTESEYVIAEYSGSNAVKSVTPMASGDVYTTAVYYVWAKSQSSVSVCLQSIINGKTYTTSSRNDNYAQDSLINIKALSQRSYTMDEVTWQPGPWQNGIKVVSPAGTNISYMNFGTYYLDIKGTDFNIKKMVKCSQGNQPAPTSQSKENASKFGQNFSSGKFAFRLSQVGFWHCWSIDFTYYADLPEKTMDFTVYDNRGAYEVYGAKINRLPGMCFGTMDGNMTQTYDWNYDHDTTAVFYDQYGNKGEFVIHPQGYELKCYPAKS